MDALAIAIGAAALLGLAEWVRRASRRAKAVAAETAREVAREVAAAEAKKVADARILVATRDHDARVARLTAQHAETARKVQEAWDIAHAMPAPGVPTVNPKRKKKPQRKKRRA